MIVNGNENATIYINEREVGKTSQKIPLNRANRNSTSIQIRKECYKTKHAIIYPNIPNVGYYLGIFNPLILMVVMP